ncbi:chromate transporter [Oikeobacillus pervagus]|uniref:Chromate transporter n=1 Tax=Oikeobacillus pervagus TaxID=1325931 RepID=A0AAJ1T062_9BACI|nr:chromate transporter [Oikeobacillus pervagus]MDQ0214902.1 chromate transporter [Oikeobacillus pervagus]
MRTYINIFIAFFRSGILGYGGGPSSIPLVHKEVVENFKWMNDDEFSDVLALANALPGPINTKMSGYIGYRVSGYIGMCIAIFASVVPTVIAMILLLTVLNAYKDRPWVYGMSQAVVPVVFVMMGVLTWEFVKKSKGTLGWGKTLWLILASIILLEFFHLHPAILIIGLLVYALLYKEKSNEQKEKSA